MSDRNFISGVILAAGRSARLGRPKQLLDLHGEPLLRHVVRAARAAALDEVVLVLGHEANAVRAAVGDLGQRVVVNPAFAAGQGTSLRAGVAAVSPTADALLVLLGDQPGVDTPALDRLLAAYRAGRDPLVVPTYGGRPGNPVLFARPLFPQLLAVEGDRGARDVVRANLGRARRVPMPAAEPPPDVDTEADYAALLESLGARRA